MHHKNCHKQTLLPHCKSLKVDFLETLIFNFQQRYVNVQKYTCPQIMQRSSTTIPLGTNVSVFAISSLKPLILACKQLTSSRFSGFFLFFKVCPRVWYIQNDFMANFKSQEHSPLYYKSFEPKFRS